jgi:hypothetical protein
MKTLTVSEINQILISKGFKPIFTIKIDPSTNKYGADRISFSELKDGYSRCVLGKFVPYEGSKGHGTIVPIINYGKASASDKKEIERIIKAL